MTVMAATQASDAFTEAKALSTAALARVVVLCIWSIMPSSIASPSDYRQALSGNGTSSVSEPTKSEIWLRYLIDHASLLSML